MKKSVTIKDVAKLANVSVATVSNVINNIDKASPETKQKVLKVMKDLDYSPNYTARSLVCKKSGLIGIIFALSDKTPVYKTLMNDNPFYTEYISGIECIARENDYDVLITGIDDEKKCKEWILKRNIDGVIFLGNYSNKIKKELGELQIPFALTDVYGQNLICPSIGIDDELGGYIAAKHLIDYGHKKIAFATSPLVPKSVNYYRYEGYKRALAEANIPLDKNMVFEGDICFEGGLNIGNRILKDKNKITAIIAAADVVAFGIIKAINNCGKSVPDHYSLVGFDDIKECLYVTPTLTTIHQDIFQKGILTVKAVLQWIEKGENKNSRVELPLKLVNRESTRKI